MQLVQLQSAKDRFERQGLGLAAISYDSEAILKDFTARKNVSYPLLSDPGSATIRAYDVLNQEATGFQVGMARPGYFFIDTKGVIREKFFETKFQERFSPNNVVGKLFPELAEEVSPPIEAPHLRLTTEQSDRTAFPGTRVALTLEVQLPADMHVYAPGVQGYKPIQLVIDPEPGIGLSPAVYPQPKILYLPAIKERVPVFEGTFRIVQDFTVSSAAEFSNSLGTSSKTVAIKGTVSYQACDKKICYLPLTVPVEWQVQVFPLDRQRVPNEIQHK